MYRQIKKENVLPSLQTFRFHTMTTPSLFEDKWSSGSVTAVWHTSRVLSKPLSPLFVTSISKSKKLLETTTEKSKTTLLRFEVVYTVNVSNES